MAALDSTSKRGVPAPEALINRARWLRAENLSLKAIADQVGLSKSTVGSYLRGEGEAIFTITCALCQREAEVFHPAARYCSTSCKNAANYSPVVPYVITCEWCGAEAIKRRHTARFCSRSCQDKAYHERRMGRA